ncbi:MAG: hypothetical protein KatS3mg114_0373 [Planctomycetaceae bacterium]|nr:MAG: hypothetical protein KatS3mg114_0373 [Planctomycetaceae bacterium]
MPLLECRHLVKDYGRKRAVDDVSFVVHPREIVGLLGPNGAGKSTSFRMTCGLISPTAGQVFFLGKDVTHWPLYKRAQLGMGYLPQETSIFGRLTVWQNIQAVLEFLPLTRKERQTRIESLLEQFGLRAMAQQLAKTLSGGQMRRLEIARCLATEPSLILLDEPFSGIDPATIHDIQDIIVELSHQRGISILLTDHRERETLTITDRNYIIYDGRVLVEGDAQTVLSHAAARKLYLGKRFDAGSILESKESFQREQPSEVDASHHATL